MQLQQQDTPVLFAQKRTALASPARRKVVTCSVQRKPETEFRIRFQAAARQRLVPMDLYDKHGHRKYLTASQWVAFLRAADSAAPEVYTFCRTLAYSGARISEALALTADRIDSADGLLILESLKKRKRGIYRAVPVPPDFLRLLADVHDLAAARQEPDSGRGVRLWTLSRCSAWRRVCEVMDAAAITGMHATPKGLRHGFGNSRRDQRCSAQHDPTLAGSCRHRYDCNLRQCRGSRGAHAAQRMWE